MAWQSSFTAKPFGSTVPIKFHISERHHTTTEKAIATHIEVSSSCSFHCNYEFSQAFNRASVGLHDGFFVFVRTTA